MTRDERIPIQVTLEEKKSIQSAANSVGTNVSRLLRLLGLRAQKFNEAVRSLRRLTAKLLQLKRLSAQQEQLSADHVAAVVDEALEPLQVVEEALTQPQPPEQAHTTES